MHPAQDTISSHTLNVALVQALRKKFSENLKTPTERSVSLVRQWWIGRGREVVELGGLEPPAF